jgi:hypothetical protein
VKRKPDILWVIIAVFGFGLLTSAYAQSYWSSQAQMPNAVSVQVQVQAGVK